jgi:2-methylcitrate dehydratase PrpD
MDASYALAKNMLSVEYEDIPQDVTELTKKHILDILGVAMGGSSRPGIKELAGLIGEWGGKEESTVLCFRLKVPAPNAAQVNASMGHALDYDDTGDGPTHPSVVIVPTCMAVAERQGKVSGREFITAVTLGMDMMCRLGQSFRSGMKTKPVGGHPGAGWHLTPLFGYIAAAGVAGRILGLDQETLVNAMGIAYHQCSGNGQCVNEGALTKRMGPGFAARGGVVAALMAQKGITGAKECLEGELGLFNLYIKGEYNPASLTADLGKRFAGTTVTMKPYPCCKGTHGSVDVALLMVNKYNIKPEDVQEITIFCPDETNFLIHPLEKRRRPENPVDSQFSLPWAVAAVFARGRAGVQDFTEEAIASSDILGMADKIRVEKDTGLAASKVESAAKIGVTNRQGQTYIERSEFKSLNAGDAQLPFSAYERKFRDCASCSIKPLSKGQLDKVISLIKQLESVDDISEVIKLLG